MTTKSLIDKTKQLIGENIKRLREAADRSVVEMAEQAGIARAYWYQIEAGTGNVTIESLGQIAEVLDVSVRDLFTEPVTVFAQSQAPSKPKRRKAS